MIWYITTYRGFEIYYDELWDEYFVIGYPFNEDYGYYFIEDAFDEIDDYIIYG